MTGDSICNGVSVWPGTISDSVRLGRLARWPPTHSRRRDLPLAHLWLNTYRTLQVAERTDRLKPRGSRSISLGSCLLYTPQHSPDPQTYIGDFLWSGLAQAGISRLQASIAEIFYFKIAWFLSRWVRYSAHHKIRYWHSIGSEMRFRFITRLLWFSLSPRFFSADRWLYIFIYNCIFFTKENLISGIFEILNSLRKLN